MSLPFTSQDALCAAMIVTACADGALNSTEARTVKHNIDVLPIFTGYEPGRFDEIAAIVENMLNEDDGIDQLLELLEQALPEKLSETVYALCCDVAASDGVLEQAELRLLEMVADRMDIDTLFRGAIQRGAAARWVRA